MTEVEGPPVPALRFSSLPIRGAETADVAGADEQAWGVNCNMAQAFEIPRENRTARHDSRPTASKPAIARYQATLSRSPLPVRSRGGSANRIWVRFRTAASASMLPAARANRPDSR